VEPLSADTFRAGMKALMDREVFGKVVFTLS
jgi:hypothetical protein